jgi:hypothetical protein
MFFEDLFGRSPPLTASQHPDEGGSALKLFLLNEIQDVM